MQAKSLVLAETNGSRIMASTQSAITLAQQLCGDIGSFDLLVIGGPQIETALEAWRCYGAARLLLVTAPELAHPTADRYAAVCAEIMQQTAADWLIGPSSTFGRDILPRVAGLLDRTMLTDVLSVVSTADGLTFQRPMYAGNLIVTVQIEDGNGVLSARGTAFDPPTTSGSTSPVMTIPFDTQTLSEGTVWIGIEQGEQKRPELTTAQVVVSGGRPLKDAETFEQLIGGLADTLGGAIGATRAAVDSGIAPNELQVGQTGKVVAPQLYIAAGISGSIQHLAGMKDSKVIVAINTDPNAPIFEVADYGLVMDLYEAIPELIKTL